MVTYLTHLNCNYQNGSEVTSICDRTLVGWSHDVLSHNWACFKGKRVEVAEPKIHIQSSVNLVSNLV